MHVTQDDVAHIALLAKLKFSPEALKKFLGEMNDILDFFATLNELDTDEVEATAQVTGMENVTRNDEIELCDIEANLVACTPNKVKDNMVAIPRIM